VVFALCAMSAVSSCAQYGRSYLVEDGLGLTSVTGLLAVITTLTLGEQGGLSCLVFYGVSVYVYETRIDEVTDG
jgi:hypothetical protein